MCTAGNLRNTVNPNWFNREAGLPYALRLEDFQMAMQDVYDFFHDVNGLLDDFRRNARGELGTRTATLHKDGVKKLRENWIYRAG